MTSKVSAVHLANVARWWLDAYNDVECYFPPDNSEEWPEDSFSFFINRDRYEQEYKDLIRQVIEFGIEDDV